MSGPLRLRHRVGESIATHGLWEPGDRVVVAVSGGLDSMGLLDLLCETVSWHGGRLSVATVDHGTRPGSEQDADFVAQAAAARGLTCQRFDLDLGPEASEATCRAARFAALDTVDADRIALAHHRDDQAETLLLRLIRGTGPRGLGAMSWRRGRYVRPLLETSRVELEQWARARSLIWREDPTNLSDRFLRNRLRAEVLPLLESLRPGAAAALARSAAVAADEGVLLDLLVDQTAEATPVDGEWPLAWVVSAPEALVRRALHRAVPSLGSAHADAVLQAARRGSGVVDLPGGHRFIVASRRLRWEESVDRSTQPVIPKKV